MSIGFVPYLVLQDYLSAIQDGQLNDQILDALDTGSKGLATRERQDAERWALEMIKGKISEKYDLSLEITPTLPYNPRLSYGAGSRVTIDFPYWKKPFDYQTGDCVIVKTDEDVQNIGYVCARDNNDLVFNNDNWISLGYQYDFYHIDYPNPIFQLNPKASINGQPITGLYNRGSIVWFAGRTWEALRDTELIDSDTLIQLGTYRNVPPSNVFPSQSALGKAYWKDLGEWKIEPYSYPAVDNELVSDQDVVKNEWHFGDNRNPLIVQAAVDLALWRLHYRISPNNIPKLREMAKDAAFQWLSDINLEVDQVSLPVNQPNTGGSFIGGSKVKQSNGY